jgi:predicted RNA-binding Zn ribbon-like protein
VIDVALLSTDQLVSLVNQFSEPTRRAAGRPRRRAFPPWSEDWSVADVERAADQLFGVFRSAPDQRQVALLLDRILQAATVHVSVDVLDGGVMRRHRTPSSEAAPAVAGALTLLQIIETAGVGRLGCCAATNCTDVFVDRSPGNNRRFCSTTCHTRERVARHRRHNR